MLTFIKNKILWFFVGGVALAATPAVLMERNEDKVEQIRTMQENALTVDGEYFQVTKTKDVHGKKAASRIDKSTLPENTEVHIYGGPKGNGYQIIVTGEKEVTSYGFGPEAESRTWTRAVRPEPVATSTERI